MDHDGSNVLSRSDLFETLFRITQFFKILIERPSGRTEPRKHYYYHLPMNVSSFKLFSWFSDSKGKMLLCNDYLLMLRDGLARLDIYHITCRESHGVHNILPYKHDLRAVDPSIYDSERCLWQLDCITGACAQME